MPIVREDIVFGLKARGRDAREAETRCAATLARLAASQLAQRRVHELSGGEVQLAAMASMLSGGRGGLAGLARPTGGFIFGWIAAAWVMGFVAERAVRERQSDWTRIMGLFAACVAGGIVVLYAIGMPWAAAVAGTPLSAVAYGSLAFIPGDLLKAVAATLAARAVLAGYPLLERAS